MLAGSERRRREPTTGGTAEGSRAAQRIQLFCVPYAGGGAAVFRAWGRGLGADVDVCALELPGRGLRLRERPLTSVDGMVDALAEQVHRRLDGPYALFGHSMGGLVAFELTRRLAACRPAPLHLFVSAIAAPHLPRPRSGMHRLPRSDLIERLRRMNGTPSQILADRELMDLVLPTIRADFHALECYAYVDGAPLPCPISAFGGLQDRMVAPDSLAAWRRHTRAEFDLQLFPGDHFFLATQEAVLLLSLSQRLRTTAEALA